ncbi:MAG: hypothetical protein ACI8ZX_002644 [Planctomycetota bacterium]|jgi:hypothetical protein
MIVDNIYLIDLIRDKFERGTCTREIAQELLISENKLDGLMIDPLCSNSILKHKQSHLENVHCSKCKYVVVPC